MLKLFEKVIIRCVGYTVSMRKNVNLPDNKRKALAASNLSKVQNRYNGDETENSQGRQVCGLDDLTKYTVLGHRPQTTR